ncbi:Rne/Rng family ribonuclease [Sphingomonas solaris]|uniref:Ribonuclease E n=2 Tax=Alterirhizorhabdus solaris TaxID=2529389 RepID=A0A558QVH9_9SPHN|nr:Rne/Rng family ribonuclease [Sphingomonas solaris]
MLIDARHREETRVAVVKGNRIEEFDFESAERKQLKGNIYLAKVTRVDPSLQAASVDYGGNRHGFLAFSEIHPDYYQIPKEDREALLREEAEHAAEEEALRGHDHDDHDDADEGGYDDHDDGEDAGERADYDAGEQGEGESDGEAGAAPRTRRTSAGGGDDSAVEALRAKRMNLRRRYKIQDVIRRRQVLLVQVVKEERGNKGAALTTYLSLAGRYCVLMPNTSHGGGISRKISNGADRKRLKSIMAELNLPKTMGCIVRTAGLQRSKGKIKRDFDYLARLWDTIRENTLGASAPAEIYGDSDLVKRAIRDIYNKDVEEILIEGVDGFHAARTFMKLLMPGHSKKITPYSDAVPLFQRFGVEEQLSAMYQPLVQLKSGGYLVINPTEALVSIDINSGRSTREHNIEQTALMTNLEAAHEIARQLRLRDMAGLVVIDFIDMENNSNNRKVEKAMKEALRNDRARIQVGRISSFGLFEMSRQRIRTGVLEASTRPCPHCDATGMVRTASSAGVSALRMLEDEAARGRGSRLCLRASTEAAFYVLNRKRAELAEIEDRYGVLIEILPDGNMEGARMSVESGGPPPAYPPRLPAPILIDADDDDDYVEEEEEEVFEADAEEETAERPERARREAGDAGEEGEDRAGRRRRRRRRRGGRREDGEELAGGDVVPGDDEESEQDAAEDAEAIAAEDADAEADEAEVEAEGQPMMGGDEAEAGAGGDDDGKRRRGRRGRRGGRRRAGEEGAVEASADAVALEQAGNNADPLTEIAEIGDDAPEVDAQVSDDQARPVEPEAAETVEETVDETPEEQPAPRARRRPRARKDAVVAPVEAEQAAPAEPVVEAAAEAEEAPKPRRGRRKKVDETTAAEAPVAEAEATGEAAPAPKPRRTRRKAEPAATPAEEVAAVIEETIAVAPAADEDEAEAPAGESRPAADEGEGTVRRGWWQRTFGA